MLTHDFAMHFNFVLNRRLALFNKKRGQLREIHCTLTSEMSSATLVYFGERVNAMLVAAATVRVLGQARRSVLDNIS